MALPDNTHHVHGAGYKSDVEPDLGLDQRLQAVADEIEERHLHSVVADVAVSSDRIELTPTPGTSTDDVAGACESIVWSHGLHVTSKSKSTVVVSNSS